MFPLGLQRKQHQAGGLMDVNREGGKEYTTERQRLMMERECGMANGGEKESRRQERKMEFVYLCRYSSRVLEEGI